MKFLYADHHFFAVVKTQDRNRLIAVLRNDMLHTRWGQMLNLIIWEDAAESILKEYREGKN